MKKFASIIGIVLIVGGGFLIYDGIQSKQTVIFKVKKELSTALKSLSNDIRKSKTKINNDPDLKIIAGGIVVASGVILLIKVLKITQ
ncbi:MAG: DUF3185 family protein [Bacteroidetes bacterium]|nr:MAG: DUF3185 family protein [Bacteroidota bacterium]